MACVPLGYAVKWAVTESEDWSSASPDGFVKYVVTAKEHVSSDCSIFSLKPKSSGTIVKTTDSSLERAIKSVQFKQPQLQIARHYTILPQTQGQDENEIRLLVRKERRGEVSGYIHRLPIGAEVELRGPCTEFAVPKGTNHVLFLAGGTGVAPAMQVAGILSNEDCHIHVLWASRRREDCAGGISDHSAVRKSRWWDLTQLWSQTQPLTTGGTESPDEMGPIVRQLQELKTCSPTTMKPKLSVDYYVDEERKFVKSGALFQLVSSAPDGAKKLLIVSGPPGFVGHWAGPKQWVNGQEAQGPVGGVLAKLDLRDWTVVKL